MVTSVLYNKKIYWDENKKQWFYFDTELPVYKNIKEK
jgi:hypothetical protein